MRATLVSLLVFCLLVVGSVVQACAYYAVLPDRVASHFNAAGVPDGWQSKGTAFIAHLGLVLGIALVILPLVCLLVRFGPASLINMPHKEYWLAEPRERDSRLSLVSYGIWALNFSLALIGTQAEIAYRASVAGLQNLGWWLWGSIAGYLLGIAVWIVIFYRRFGKLPAEAPSDPID